MQIALHRNIIVGFTPTATIVNVTVRLKTQFVRRPTFSKSAHNTLRTSIYLKPTVLPP